MWPSPISLQHFIATMQGLGEVQADFDEGIWNVLVEEMTAFSRKEIVVWFFDGVKVRV